VVKLVNRGEASDSFAAHFAKHFEDTNVDATKGTVRKMVEAKMLWKGDPIQCMKSFGKNTCALCMQERLEILKRIREEPMKLINSNNELHGACRHKTRFHRFVLSEDGKFSTDDGTSPERVRQSPRTPSSTMTHPPGESDACQLVDDVDAARAEI